MDPSFPLRERTVVISGPFSTLTQSLMMGLAGCGADVFLMGADAAKGDRFSVQVSDQREINPKHGRARCLNVNLQNFSDIQEALGNAAQTFGGIDIFIDAHFSSLPGQIEVSDSQHEIAKMIDENLKATLAVTQCIAGYLKSRKKGRILFLIPEVFLAGEPADALHAATRGGLIHYAEALANQMKADNVTVNTMKIGFTEEYLLGHFPGVSVKEALGLQQKKTPYARLLEPDRLTAAAIFFLGPQGVSVTGQSLAVS